MTESVMAATQADAGAGTARVLPGEIPGQAYLTQEDTTGLNKNACLDDPACFGIAFQTKCETDDIGSLLQANSSLMRFCSDGGNQMGKMLKRYELRYSHPGDGVTLNGDGIAPEKDFHAGAWERTQDHVWKDYFGDTSK